MNVGKLYKINKYFWVLFPSKETVVDSPDANSAAASTVWAVEELASYWSKVLDCNVSHVAEKSLFMLLEKDNKICKILTTDGNIGWFAYSEDTEWSKDCIEEVNHVHS